MSSGQVKGDVINACRNQHYQMLFHWLNMVQVMGDVISIWKWVGDVITNRDFCAGI